MPLVGRNISLELIEKRLSQTRCVLPKRYRFVMRGPVFDPEEFQGCELLSLSELAKLPPEEHQHKAGTPGGKQDRDVINVRSSIVLNSLSRHHWWCRDGRIDR